MPGSSLRFLGPSIRVAIPLAILWGVACSFQAALIVHITITLTTGTTRDVYEEHHELIDNDQSDMIVLSAIELGLAALTIAAVLVVLRIDCKYDPD